MEEGKLALKIITPDGFSITEDVDEVVAPGTEGEFGVLYGHTHFITTLSTGILTFRQGKTVKKVQVASAYAKVEPDNVLILSDSAGFVE
ncbi:hypothetical protein [Candidatus Magnetomonas plexicatena]|uniref:hypothetical protein n=1 Tax=Candidatus Magnetomonas plexicatena TaxID=2552947 RepID=UPI001C76D665|nr:hypothetical protein E2O03_002795 [Nitrospirales bacterium LBB_01]